jgi:hypothetical protein
MTFFAIRDGEYVFIRVDLSRIVTIRIILRRIVDVGEHQRLNAETISTIVPMAPKSADVKMMSRSVPIPKVTSHMTVSLLSIRDMCIFSITRG